MEERLIHLPKALWLTTDEIFCRWNDQKQNLAPRLRSIAFELSIEYLGDWIHYTKNDLLSFPGIGRKTVYEMQEVLLFFGYQFGMRIHNWLQYRSSAYPNILHSLDRYIEKKHKIPIDELKRWKKTLTELDAKHNNDAKSTIDYLTVIKDKITRSIQ